ncbi:MAG: ACP S-malonyltransferase [Chloroflexi bacterium]|nr:ACP S-malonyltransferase [Chloroflexota bacterium]
MNLNPKTTAFVFPGQGSQAVGMGRDLAQAYPIARQTFEEADALLGFSLSQLMWAGPAEELNETVNTQPALYVHSMAALRVFSQLYPDFVPAAVAGHSLGELSALTAAGALPFAEGLQLVRRRGELMKRAGEIAPGGMAAVLNLDIPALEAVCAQASTEAEIVQVANDNCPGQVVISGAKAAVERAIAGTKAAGAKRAIPLAVSIAAHSPLMAPIQADFEAAVRAAPMGAARILVVSNVKAGPITSAEQLRWDLVAQHTSRVRWTESVQYLIGQGIQSFVELGSGNVLLGLIRRIDSSVEGLALGAPQDFEALQAA